MQPWWFRNGIPQFTVPTENTPDHVHPPTPLTAPAAGWRGEWEAQEGKPCPGWKQENTPKLTPANKQIFLKLKENRERS